ncbi:MAG: hypothetical protein HYX84_05565 [Chloroflexi bacterium]|nr:hypothetical protein [Chloroflexota bacterium]
MLIMMLNVVSIIAMLCAGIFSVLGLNPEWARKPVFAALPASRFYSNAVNGIAKMETLEGTFVDPKQQEQHPAWILQNGAISKPDVGFAEVAKILAENGVNTRLIRIIAIEEKRSPIFISGSTPITPPTYTELRIQREHEEPSRIISNPYEPDRPARELRQWALTSFYKRLSYWILVFLLVSSASQLLLIHLNRKKKRLHFSV